MPKSAVYDYSTTAANNTEIDGVDSTGTTGLVKSGDNYARSMMAHAKGFALDLGSVNTVGGTADAITVTLSSAPSALVDGMRITINASAANTGATTLNVTPAGGSAFGAKKVMKWSAGSEAELSAGDIPAANALVELIYDSARNTAAGAWMLLGSSVAAATTSAAGIVELATQTEAATLTDTSRAITADGLVFLGGYTTTATAAGTTTLTVTSTYNQYFTGATTQTVQLPVTSTLVLGRAFRIVNTSTGVVTVNSSGGNAVYTLAPNETCIVTCILTSGTGAASWATAPAPTGVGYACRAWVTFQGDGTVAVNASGNVSSITDNNTGDYTVNFTTAMPDGHYAVVGTPTSLGVANVQGTLNISAASATSAPSTKSTTACRIVTGIGSSGAVTDYRTVCVSFFR